LGWILSFFRFFDPIFSTESLRTRTTHAYNLNNLTGIDQEDWSLRRPPFPK
jgi:hypothetical protein